MEQVGYKFMDEREFRMLIRKLRAKLQTFYPPQNRENRKHYRKYGDYPF